MNKERYKMPVSVQVILFNKNNEVLLLKRNSTGFSDGLYGFIGGHVEKNEMVINAAIRETKEEIGIDINREDLVFKSVMNRKVDKNTEYIDFVFIVKDWQGNIKNMEADKCSELVWCKPNNLPKNIIDFEKYLIDNQDVFLSWGWKT
ncbi:MAG: NUDIX domain-containing protein [Clostridia bacterium]|nr:NUDIX domain-containing protein [Clostridia bacterium]